MTDQLIQQRLESLTPEYRSFVESSFVTDAALAFAEKLGVTGRSVEVIENTFFLYLLSFFTTETSARLLSEGCTLSKEEGEMLMYAFTASLPTELTDLIERDHVRMFSEPPTELASEIAQTERDFENLQGIRTMAADMRAAQTHHVPTHQSSQSDIFQSTTPTPQPPSGPQWETDK